MRAAKRPNILIFMTDHQRGDTVLPEHPAITPNLTAFARQGLTFTNTFCPSPHCCPSRATFFTGLYPTRHGVWNNICNGQALSPGLRPGTRLFSDDLLQAGYAMAYAGKWHVSTLETPKDRGWREYAVSATRSARHSPDWSAYRHWAEEGEPAERGEGQILRPGWTPYTMYANTGDRANAHDEGVLADTLAALPELARSGQPWLMYAGCIGPHDPYNVPSRYLDLYKLEDVPLPLSYADSLEDKPRIYQRMRRTRWDQLSPHEIRDGIRHFWAYCTYLDELFGKVLAALDATGQADNTLVLYTSDHGDYCGEHGLFAKGIPCFRGAYHVPAMIRWPAGLASPGRREEAFVSLADFAPTFTELGGGTPDPTLTGRSLTPFLRGQAPADWRDEVHTQCNGVELYFTQRSVATRDWKYVFNGFDQDELYDRRNDPHEMCNLAGRAESTEVTRQMCRRMWRFACREQDTMISNYITVALTPHGPAEAFR